MKNKSSSSKDVAAILQPRLGGVDYSKVHDKIIEDARFIREKSQPYSSQLPSGSMSSTFDAFVRMQAGVEGRSLTQKISDSNRPTWESYKKENEEKLDRVSGDAKKMAEYRKQLDAEREERLAGTKRLSRELSDSDEESNKVSKKKTSKSKKEKKNKKNHKKEKKKKIHKRKEEDLESGDESEISSDSD